MPGLGLRRPKERWPQYGLDTADDGRHEGRASDQVSVQVTEEKAVIAGWVAELSRMTACLQTQIGQILHQSRKKSLISNGSIRACVASQD